MMGEGGGDNRHECWLDYGSGHAPAAELFAGDWASEPAPHDVAAAPAALSTTTPSCKYSCFAHAMRVLVTSYIVCHHTKTFCSCAPSLCRRGRSHSAPHAGSHRCSRGAPSALQRALFGAWRAHRGAVCGVWRADDVSLQVQLGQGAAAQVGGGGRGQPTMNENGVADVIGWQLYTDHAHMLHIRPWHCMLLGVAQQPAQPPACAASAAVSTTAPGSMPLSKAACLAAHCSKLHPTIGCTTDTKLLCKPAVMHNQLSPAMPLTMILGNCRWASAICGAVHKAQVPAAPHIPCCACPLPPSPPPPQVAWPVQQGPGGPCGAQPAADGGHHHHVRPVCGRLQQPATARRGCRQAGQAREWRGGRCNLTSQQPG
jgi:hypothetical protein